MTRQRARDSARPILLSFLIIGLLVAGLIIGLMRAIDQVWQEGQGSDALHLWRDEAGDLWIETPLYRWNITGGESISLFAAGEWRAWQPEEHGGGARIVDSLFLSSPLSGPPRARVIFSLPDRAAVYVERDARDGTEGLELAFRASDGLVRVTHSWLGGDVPTRVQEASRHLARLEAQFVREMMQGLDADERIHLAATYSFFVRFDPAAQDLYAGSDQLEGRRETGWTGRVCSDDADAQRTGDGDPWSRDIEALNPDDPCRFSGFLLPGHLLGSEYLQLYSENPLKILQPAQVDRESARREAPDLDAAYVTRLPRYSYRAAPSGPRPGEVVTYVAQVANAGAEPSGPFDYAWRIDGQPPLSGTHPSLDPGERITLTQTWSWEVGPHTLTLRLDPDDAISEVSEWNNVREERTDALSVGFWVEQSVHDYFNAHQIERGLGAVSWEDWAQRQIDVLNQMFADAVHPLTPEGIVERVRLDRVVVVPDGSLPPCATNYPDVTDETVDLQWGFPAELVGVDTGHACGALGYYLDHSRAQDVDYALLHELSHARYLVDLYGLDVPVPRVNLSQRLEVAVPVIPVDQDVGDDPRFPTPTYLAIGGELVVCHAREGDRFVQCMRGAEGTRARPHPVGTAVRLAVVRVQDGRGNLVQGSDALPVEGNFLYRNRYPLDLMSGGIAFGQHSAYAWNRIAGQRACCGNSNAPSNLGEYLNDMPQQNVVEVRDDAGRPLVGARVEVYRAKPFPAWYGKVYWRKPDAVHWTDDRGRARLGRNPFTGGADVTHGYGHSDAVVLLGISSDERTTYRFLDVTEANEAHWSGHQEVAVYPITVSGD
jgi:hypothetical protein